MPVHPYLNGEIEMAERPGGELDIHEPAPDTCPFRKSRVDRDDIAGQIAGSVNKMAAMGQHVVTPQIGLGILRGLAGIGAGDDERLDRIRHWVAMRVVAVPCLQCNQLTHFIGNERLCSLQACVKALHVADLQYLAGLFDRILENEALLHCHANRLLAKDVLAGFKSLDGCGDMEGVSRRDDNRVEVRISEHRVVVVVGFAHHG